ncbi:C45 family peptidase [Reichenbachiella ulvae]|uniref:C45 family peptidase n=1 Tax=Reichenbachiella ulvae TaxID=2980104 RepID=A0ABT3CX23_9BACT|nr:C45 family peptidase [Reichenbachiella ulvae]MCV9388251.1 C45 family peptidase [Reichenbachiella ulvae]
MAKKNKYYLWMGLSACLAVGLGITYSLSPQPYDPVPGSCTIFSAAIGDRVLFGNNEDYYKPKTYLWTDQGAKGDYGSIYLGFKDYSHQGGINEKGLCFDANALPKSPINLHPELKAPLHYQAPYEEHMMWLPVMILRKAATVKEAIEIAKEYKKDNWYPIDGSVKYQLHFADASGDAVVISVDESGELAFTQKEKDEHFLISTNYNKVNPDNALEYPCHRYSIAEQRLAAVDSEEELTVDLFRSILDEVHEEGIFNTTLYSNIFDLKEGKIYLYHWHQYDEVVILDVKEELVKAPYLIRIKELFSNETAGKASFEYGGWIIGLSGSILLATGLGVAGVYYLKNKSWSKKPLPPVGTFPREGL